MNDPAEQPEVDQEELSRTFYAAVRDVAARMMRHERAGHTLQPTAVANEACLRMLRHPVPSIPREQQLAIAGRVLRQVLIDHARAHNAAKRGGGAATGPIRLELDESLVHRDAAPVDVDSIHQALERLAERHPRQAEVLSLRIFAGLDVAQIAVVLGCSRRTVESDWTVARAWMRRELESAR